MHFAAPVDTVMLMVESLDLGNKDLVTELTGRRGVVSSLPDIRVT